MLFHVSSNTGWLTSVTVVLDIEGCGFSSEISFEVILCRM